MSLLEKLKSWVDRDARKLASYSIPRDHVKDPRYSDAALAGGASYVRLWLAEMHLRKDRAWFKDCYPALHSVAGFQFGTSRVEIPKIAGPMNFPELNAGKLNNSVQVDYPLSGLLPFNGGVLEWTAGLTAVFGDSNLNPFLKTIGAFSEIFLAPPISSAIAAAAPVAEAFQDLLGTANGELHLGMHRAFVGAGAGVANELRAGYYFTALAPPADLPRESLWIDSGQVRKGPSLAQSDPLTGVSYMLLRIEARDQHDDWESLKEIAKPYQDAMHALRNRNKDRAEDLIREAVLMGLVSNDLTKADRNRVAKEIADQFEAAKGAGLGAVETGAPASLKSLMESAMSTDAALKLGNLSLRTLFPS